MATNNKPTKRDNYLEIRNILADVECEQRLIDFIDHEIELLDKKSAKSANGVSEEKIKNAELVFEVLAELGRSVTPSELINSSERLRDGGIASPQKVVPLLSYLVDEGRVTKTSAGKKSMVYAVNA